MFEEEGSGYFVGVGGKTDDSTFAPFAKKIHTAMIFPQPSDPPLKMVLAPNSSARTVLQSTGTSPAWDEHILQLYNLVTPAITPKDAEEWWKCSSVFGGDSTDSSDPTCALVKTMYKVPSGDNWFAVDTATSDAFGKYGETFLGYSSGSYLQSVNDPCALANYFNWFLLVNHSGTKSNAYFPPSDFQTTTKFSYLVSAECQSDSCSCRNTQQPATNTTQSKKSVNCGVIDAFNTWDRDQVVRFTQSLTNTSGAKMGLFQYNVIDDAWW